MKLILKLSRVTSTQDHLQSDPWGHKRECIHLLYHILGKSLKNL
jgi:hypothetical protein